MNQTAQVNNSRFLDCVNNCAKGDIENIEKFYSNTIVSLAHFIPCNFTTYDEFNLKAPSIYNIGSTPESSSCEIPQLLGLYKNDHAVLAHFLQTGDGQANRISDFSSQKQFRNTGLYSDFYRDYGISEDLCIGLSLDSSQCVSIVWHRDRGFTEHERNAANLIRPFVIQIWQNAHILHKMHAQLQLFECGLEGAAVGLISCDIKGNVRMSTALARQYLIDYLGSAKNLSRVLPDQILGWFRSQATQSRPQDLTPHGAPLIFRKGDSRLVVRFLPRDVGNLLLLEETRSDRIATALDQLPLSCRESEVFACVAKGRTNSEIASILNISLSTVKKHLQSILEKLGVESRTAAVALALQTFPYDR